MPQIDRRREEQICNIWNRLRLRAADAKEPFITKAIEAARYYDGPNHDFVYEGTEPPDFKVTINKVYELVSIFSPMIYAQNPVRNVEPRKNGRPEVAMALDGYLNYTPGDFGLKAAAKSEVDEALINGRGCMMTGVDAKSGMVISVAERTKNILLDPTPDRWYDGHYMMRYRRAQPLWKVARIFGPAVARRLVDADQLKGGRADETWFKDGRGYDEPKLNSQERAETDAYDGKKVSYIEVYSKMGIGLRADKQDEESNRYALGNDSKDNILLIYEPNAKIIMHTGPWPIPFWADHGKHSWPVSFYDPAESQDRVWPISLITPALGLQKFLDWGWSFALGHIKVAARNIMVGSTEMNDKLKAAINSNRSNIFVPIDEPNPDRFEHLWKQLEMPQLNSALVDMLNQVELLFEKTTGLYEVLYGQSAKQYRSATEAQVKAEFSRLRIDDTVDRAEDWQAEVARKEAIGARWLLSGEQLAPILGPELAQAWDVYRPGDLREVMREYDYTITAGSMRKRTPQHRAEVAAQRMDRILPLMISIGDLEGVNAVVGEWEAANGNPHPGKYELRAPPPPEMATGANAQQEQPLGPQQAPEVMAIESGEPVMGMPT